MRHNDTIIKKMQEVAGKNFNFKRLDRAIQQTELKEGALMACAFAFATYRGRDENFVRLRADFYKKYAIEIWKITSAISQDSGLPKPEVTDTDRFIEVTAELLRENVITGCKRRQAVLVILHTFTVEVKESTIRNKLNRALNN